jgi:hypothetical protein
MSDIVIDEVQRLEEKASKLSTRVEALEKAKLAIEAERDARKRALKALMDECKKELGIDPNDLEDEIKKSKEVLSVKLQIIERDVEVAEKVLIPMLAEIEKG